MGKKYSRMNIKERVAARPAKKNLHNTQMKSWWWQQITSLMVKKCIYLMDFVFRVGEENSEPCIMNENIIKIINCICLVNSWCLLHNDTYPGTLEIHFLRHFEEEQKAAAEMEIKFFFKSPRFIKNHSIILFNSIMLFKQHEVATEWNSLQNEGFNFAYFIKYHAKVRETLQLFITLFN